MSYFVCDHGTKYFPFGKSELHLQNLLDILQEEDYASQSVHRFPLQECMSSLKGENSERATPLVVREPDGETAHVFRKLATDVITATFNRQARAQMVFFKSQ